MTDLAHPLPHQAGARTAATGLLRRLAALSVLVAVVTALSWVGVAAWWALHDAFVAPMSLSPDSAVVMENKLRLTELELERARAMAEAEAATAEVADAEAELGGLSKLKSTVAAARPWTQTLHTEEASTGVAELNNLARREAVLARMIAKQRKVVATSQSNLEAGVINRADFEREEQRLDELSLSALETARSRMEAELSVRKVRLGQRSLAGEQGAPPMPEVVAREDLSVRIELQLLHLDARKRARLAEREALLFRVQKIDELISQLQRLPVFQAADAQLDVAFVPYTQLRGVQVGAEVIRCTAVVFGCRVVGEVSALIPGEVVQSDPWGTTERGQYALLQMSDRTALQARTLRVRGGR